MPKKSPLAEALGLSIPAIEETIRQDVLEAAEIVAEEFRRVLVALQVDSASGVFEGYEVVIDIEPTTISKPNIGRLRVPQCHIWVKSPNPDLNVFDILDTGRAGLPKRDGNESPYPQWGVGDGRTVSQPGESRRDRAGRFSISSPKSNYRGKRPERLRYKLMGPKPKNAQYSPAYFTRGPIRPVPPNNLYKRVYDRAKKKLRERGFKHYDLLIVQRKD